MIARARDLRGGLPAWAAGEQTAFQEEHTTHPVHRARTPALTEHEAEKTWPYPPHPSNPFVTPAGGASYPLTRSPEHQNAALSAHSPRAYGDRARPVTQHPPYAAANPDHLTYSHTRHAGPSTASDEFGLPGPLDVDTDHQDFPGPHALHQDFLHPDGRRQRLPHADGLHQGDPDPFGPSGDQGCSHAPATAVDPQDTMVIPSSATRAQIRRTPVASPLQRFRDAVVSQGPALDPGKPGLRVLLAVGALAVAVAAFLVWRAQPKPQPLPAPVPVTPASPSPTAQVTVHVAGKIRKPGVYLLPSGARVTDAVTAAGGLTRGASIGALNLARRLIDGEQIVVGARTTPAGQGPSVVDPAGALIDLNTATPEQLEQLPGVGEVLAGRIVEYRTSRGGFTSIDQLRDVSGIGTSRFEEIKPKVRI